MQTTLSTPVRQNLLSMRSTADMLSKTQVRLATGKRVNSALDNPTSFFQAKSLDNRAAQLTQLLDQMNMAQSTVEAADNAISAINDLVGQARGLAQQALSAPGATSTLTATAAFTAGTAGTIDIVVDGTATQVSISATDTAADFAASISDVDGVRASVDGTGRVVIEAKGHTVSVANSTSGDDGFTGAETAAVTADPVRTALAEQFNAVRTQIDEIARDAGFNGVNLLGGDSLNVVLNEQSSSSGKQSSLKLDGQTVDSTALGVSQITAFNAASNITGGFQMDSAISGAMDELTAAVGKLESISSSYASDTAVLQIREDFTNDMIATLQGGAADLTEADVNEESAKMLALQTRQQLASTAMALSAQAEQSVLRLF